ncbi:MAG: hypothetical protein U9N13_06780 [Euryarchaeota archaeon]|nr:hypothetical protein [Euryarchaeota archaeon]
MRNKLTILLAIFVITMVAVSGCTDKDATGGEETVELTVIDMVTLKEIPAGFEFLGARDILVSDVQAEYANVSGVVGAADGIYRNGDDKVEIHIVAIECADADAAEELVVQYKSSFTPLARGDRFVEQSFNGHFATRILDYTTVDSEQVERYSYVWSNNSIVFDVSGGTSDATLTRSFAEATGF